MNVSWLIMNARCTGGIRVYLEEINELVKRGHKVTIVGMQNMDCSKWFNLDPEVKVIDVKPPFKYGTPFNMIAGLYKMAKACPKADVNISGHPIAYPSGFLNGKGKEVWYMQHYESMFFNGLSRAFIRGAYSLPRDRVIVNSLFLKNIMERRYGFKTSLINPAINHDIFYPRKIKKFKKTKGVKRIVCLGKIEQRFKGVEEALRAFKHLDNYKNELVFFGTKPIDQRQLPDDIKFVPFKFIEFPSDDELAELYSSADLTLCPSWYESFPLPPLEAMACGSPVVTTSLGVSDYCKDGYNSYVIPPRDPKIMAIMMDMLLNKKAVQKKFIRNGLKTAKQFTYSNTADNLEKVLKKVIKCK